MQESPTPQHNINNWHWTEKDFSEWATGRLKELLTFTNKVDNVTEIEVKQDEIKGEAFKYIRKNKVHLSYNYKAKLNFKVNTPGHDVIEGVIKLEPFVDEPIDDWEYEIKIKNVAKVPSEEIKRTNELVGRSLIIPRIQTFIQEFDKKME